MGTNELHIEGPVMEDRHTRPAGNCREHPPLVRSYGVAARRPCRCVYIGTYNHYAPYRTSLRIYTLRRQSCGNSSRTGACDQNRPPGHWDAGVYDALNRDDFTVSDLVNTSTEVMDYGYDTKKGGTYIRNHPSNESVTRLRKSTKHLCVGKTVNYGHRYTGHKCKASSYGNLTRTSTPLDMFSVCIFRPNDIEDLAYLTEQIFVCLFESHRGHLFSPESRTK
jgi:hypothetical protein